MIAVLILILFAEQILSLGEVSNHTLHFHNEKSGTILPEERISPSIINGFIVEGRFIPYDDIWQADELRDQAHTKFNRHFPRPTTDFENEDANIDKDMLIYVVLLICLIIPYAGMVLFRKLCPQVLHGEAAVETQKEKQRKGKSGDNKAIEKAIVEIDLNRKKKERDQLNQIATGARGIYKLTPVIKPIHPQQQQWEPIRKSYSAKNVKDEVGRNSNNIVRRNRAEALLAVEINAALDALRFRNQNNGNVNSLSGTKFRQQVIIIRNCGDCPITADGGVRIASSSQLGLESIKVTRLIRENDNPYEADDEGDGSQVYYEFSKDSYNLLKENEINTSEKIAGCKTQEDSEYGISELPV